MSYCPKCGAEAADGQNYCRKCGVNLALVTKAVNLGEVIARGDNGLMPKIRNFMGNMKLDEVSEQVGRHLEMINETLKTPSRDTAESVRPTSLMLPNWGCETKKAKKAKSAGDRRARLLSEGFPSLFVGIAMMVLLFVFSDLLVLKIPPEKVARIPFDVLQAARYAWMLGLIPTLSGLGKLVAASFIGSKTEADGASEAKTPQIAAPVDAVPYEFHGAPPSVTEHTTARLDARARMRASE